MCSTEEDCQISCMHAEHQRTSVPGASRHKKHETRFVTSTVRLPSPQKQQKWGFPCLRPWKACSKPQAALLQPRHAFSCFFLDNTSSHAPSKQPGPPLSWKAASISNSAAPIITADVASVFFLDDSNTERSSQSTAKQHGPAQATAPSSSKASRRDDFNLSYVAYVMKGDPGIVPLITVGSVFTLIKTRCVAFPIVLHAAVSQPTCELCAEYIRGEPVIVPVTAGGSVVTLIKSSCDCRLLLRMQCSRADPIRTQCVLQPPALNACCSPNAIAREPLLCEYLCCAYAKWSITVLGIDNAW